jgi:hypothetical protein
MTRNRNAYYRQHAIRHHRSGMAIADRIAAVMLFAMLVGGMYGMVAYANWRDSREFCNHHASVPTRPQDDDDLDTQPHTLTYLDAQPPA